MSNDQSEVTFGLSPERMAQLLACRPEEGHKPAVVQTLTPKERNRLAQARWRAAHPELARERTLQSMRRRRLKMKANGEKVR
jgi:hypothetical protein